MRSESDRLSIHEKAALRAHFEVTGFRLFYVLVLNPPKRMVLVLVIEWAFLSASTITRNSTSKREMATALLRQRERDFVNLPCEGKVSLIVGADGCDRVPSHFEWLQPMPEERSLEFSFSNFLAIDPQC